MRLYILPISTRRTLLYCKRPHHPHQDPTLAAVAAAVDPSSSLSSSSTSSTAAIPPKTPWIDKITEKAARLWANWEKKDKGWQRMTVDYGNRALRRIPYEEWGLKSVPPLSNRRKAEEMLASGSKELIERLRTKGVGPGPGRLELVFPPAMIAPERAIGVLRRLATERQILHKKKLAWCFVGMPITIPIGILPIVPNLPFFYLCYRAWSHWRALEGGKHAKWLVDNNLLSPTPSPFLDSIYAPPRPETPTIATPVSTVPTSDPDHLGVNGNSADPSAEIMLLTQENGRRLAEGLDLPELEIELERAIWQVENTINEKKKEVLAKTTGTLAEKDEQEGEGEGEGEGKREKSKI